LSSLNLTIHSLMSFLCFNFFHNIQSFFIDKKRLNIKSTSCFYRFNNFTTLIPSVHSFEVSLNELEYTLGQHSSLLPVIYITIGDQMFHTSVFRKKVIELLDFITNIGTTFETHTSLFINATYQLIYSLNIDK
jgi:hypothetical protein